MSTAARILALHAHPDDLEFQCAGVLALLRRAGCPVIMASMTPGDCGSAEHDTEEIARIRRAEAAAAAALIDATCWCLEFRDLAIFNTDEARRRVVEAIRRARPSIVITAPPVDYMADHEITSALVRDACFAASAPLYTTRQWEPALALERIPHLYFVDPVQGVDREGRPVVPDFHVDTSEVFELKRAMLACHASQRNWLMRQHAVDEYLDAQAQWSGQRGREIGVAHAEGLRQYRGHPYPTDNLLLDIIGQDGRGGRAAPAQAMSPD